MRVLFIPGFPASHLKVDGTNFYLRPSFSNPHLLGPDDLTVPDPVVPGDPIKVGLTFLLIDLAKQAQTLYDLLASMNVGVEPFGWDWRRPIDEQVVPTAAGPTPGTGARLAATIRRLAQEEGAPIPVVAHSTGGLLLRDCLERDPALAGSIAQVIAFGVPWAGAPKSIAYVNAQEGLGPLVTPAKAQEVVAHAWAAFDLFPPNPQNLVDSAGRPLDLTVDFQLHPASALTNLGWIAGLPAALQQGARDRAARSDGLLGARRPDFRLQGNPLTIWNVVGWGARTFVRAILDNHSMEVREGDGSAGLNGGDGTAPRVSAAWLQGNADLAVHTFHVPVGMIRGTDLEKHKSLWNNPGGKAILRHVLQQQPLPPFCFAALEEADFHAFGQTPVRVWVQAHDTQGRPLAGATVRTIDLAGPHQVQQSFTTGTDGRLMLQIPRALMRLVPPANAFRRCELEIAAPGIAPQRQAFVCNP